MAFLPDFGNMKPNPHNYEIGLFIIIIGYIIMIENHDQTKYEYIDHNSLL